VKKAAPKGLASKQPITKAHFNHQEATPNKSFQKTRGDSMDRRKQPEFSTPQVAKSKAGDRNPLADQRNHRPSQMANNYMREQKQTGLVSTTLVPTQKKEEAKGWAGVNSRDVGLNGQAPLT